MAKIIENIQLDLAYRLGENAVPTSTGEYNKRLSWFVKALEFLLTEKPLWFMEYDFPEITTTTATNTYSNPTNCRKITQIKVNGYKYEKAPFDEVYDRYEKGTAIVAPPFLTERVYYTRANQFILIPTPAIGSKILVSGYQETPTMPTNKNSGIIVPDNYSDLLVSFAEGRYWSSAHKRAKASDAFGEFTDWVEKIKLEDMRRHFGEH